MPTSPSDFVSKCNGLRGFFCLVWGTNGAIEGGEGGAEEELIVGG